MEELLNNSSFRKWTKGEASREEKEYWDQWVKASPENRKLALKAQQKIAGFPVQTSDTSNVHEGWKRLEASLEQESKLHRIEMASAKRNKGLNWVWRIAAVLSVIAITGLSVYFFYQEEESAKQKNNIVKHEIKTDYGERKTLSLSDGSEITLNAHSTLIYKTSNPDKYDIEVYLEGEAYFSVAERQDSNSSPFRVRTSTGQIEVLGTEFVVSARNSKTRVVLKEGSVAIDPIKPDQQVLLEPEEMAELDSSWETVRTKFVNPEVYTSWRTRVLVFDKTPLADVIDRLEYTFGVNVTVRDPDLFKQKISGSIENDGLKVITSALAKTLDTSFYISENTVYLGK